MTGPELHALRLRLGYSLSQLAKATGLNPSTICRYQSGALTITPSVEKAILGEQYRRALVEIAGRGCACSAIARSALTLHRQSR